MENKKKQMTKKQYNNDIIDILRGTKEVDDLQIYIDYLVKQNELLDKKASNSTHSKVQQENEVLRKYIIEVLEQATQALSIREIQVQHETLAGLSNQKISALLTQLESNGFIKRSKIKKISYFELI